MKITLRNTLQHFKKINSHKWHVFRYCMKAGIPWRGIKHDMSKFSPTEFWESVRYYQGNRSPIDACKEAEGVSKAWMHHKGRNSHHYEYWQDNFDKGGEPVIMPFKNVLELLCDYLGAGRAYMGKEFSYNAELAWWQAKKSKPIAMHPATIEFIDIVFEDLARDELNIDAVAAVNRNLNKSFLKALYNEICKAWLIKKEMSING